MSGTVVLFAICFVNVFNHMIVINMQLLIIINAIYNGNVEGRWMNLTFKKKTTGSKTNKYKEER